MAIGYTLVYGIIELINFAHGEVFMIGSFVAVSLFGTLGLTASTGIGGLVLGLIVALIVSMIACGTLNVLIEKVAYRPLRSAPKLAPLITAVGISFILQNVGLLWRGGSPQSITDLIDSQHVLVTIFGVPITNGDLLAVGVTFPLVYLMTTFIARSRLGKAMRATAQEPDAARLMGINVDTTISLTFLIGGMLAGAGGLIYALFQTTIWYFQGFTAGLIAFTAAVMGGIGNIRGRRARRADHRLHPAALRQPHRHRVDTGRRVRLPHPHHGLPSLRPPRRGDEGGRMTAAAVPETATSGPPPGAHRMPKAARFGLTGLACAAAIIIPLFIDSGGNVMNNLVLAAGVRGDGAGAEHHRRLRRPARPGLRRVLRDRRLHHGLLRLRRSTRTRAAGTASTSSSPGRRRTCRASTSTS